MWVMGKLYIYVYSSSCGKLLIMGKHTHLRKVSALTACAVLYQDICLVVHVLFEIHLVAAFRTV